MEIEVKVKGPGSGRESGITALQAAVKETNRLLKIEAEFSSDSIKRLSEDTITNNHSVKALEKRLGDLEKKVKK